LESIDAGMDVYTTGGVFKAGELVLDPMRAALLIASKNSSVHEAAFTPIIGSLLLALQSAGAKISEDMIDTIRRTLPQSAISKHKDSD
jgi:hypothetical protein